MIKVNPLKLAMVRDIVQALDEKTGPVLNLNDLARRVKQYGSRYDPGRSMQEILEVVRKLSEVLGLEVK